MIITNSAQYDTTIYTSLNQYEKPTMVNGKIPGLSHDSVSLEISQEGRQLAESDIIHHAARYFGTTQINEALNQTLKNQPSDVTEAVHGLIQSNFITNNTEVSEDERDALIEMGLSQAEYIANNYIDENKRDEFMNTIKQIAGIAKTGTKNSVTGEISYETPTQRPVGAPEDYIKITDLMRKYEPDTMTKLQDAIVNNKDWGTILVSFAKKAAANQSWQQEFREESDAQMKKIMERGSENRFKTTATTNSADFASDMKNQLDKAGFSGNLFLHNNLDHFVRTIERLNANSVK